MVLLTHGATLKSADGARNAWRVHAALAPDPAHKVNGGPGHRVGCCTPTLGRPATGMQLTGNAGSVLSS